VAQEPESDEPKIYLLPNLMTAGNLACGFFAVLMIFKGMQEVQRLSVDVPLDAKQYYAVVRQYYEFAILLIFGSCIFDLLDGRLARLGGQDSPFGREFDSLADIISFGMAPAMLLSKAVLFALPVNIGWFLAFLYLLCGAIRLARFNCLAAMPPSPKRSYDFRGIPIPMAAGFIASLTLFIINIYENDGEIGMARWVLASSMLGLSILMISNLRYPSFKGVGWRTSANPWTIVAAVLVIFFTVRFYTVMPVVLFSIYLAYGLVRPLISKRLRREIEQEIELGGDDLDEDAEPRPELPKS
jgi:CDP-diacylglycerol--serine O-phosphatidyltransferase